MSIPTRDTPYWWRDDYAKVQGRVRPSSKYDREDFLQFCALPDSDESLLPQMRDFARRMRVPGWDTLNRQQLCQEIRQLVLLTDLPPEMVTEIGKWLRVHQRLALKGTSKSLYQKVPAADLKHQFIQQYGQRAFEVLFGSNVSSITPLQHMAAKTFASDYNTYFKLHDLDNVFSMPTDQEFASSYVEFIPAVEHILRPVTQQHLLIVYNNQIHENNIRHERKQVRIPISIPLVRIQTTQDHGADTTACATIRITEQGAHEVTIYTPPVYTQSLQQAALVGPPARVAILEYPPMENDEDFAQSTQLFPTEEGWYVVTDYKYEHWSLLWLSLRQECGMLRRSQIAQTYMNAIIWSIRFQQEHPKVPSILANITKPNILKGENIYWETKAREERAVQELLRYKFQTPSGNYVALPIDSWVADIVQTKEYKYTFYLWYQDTQENHYNEHVLIRMMRNMDALDLHTKIFRPLQRKVQLWWEENVLSTAPQALHDSTPSI